eukprot:199447-Hanusia_phi.AAC.3
MASLGNTMSALMVRESEEWRERGGGGDTTDQQWKRLDDVKGRDKPSMGRARVKIVGARTRMVAVIVVPSRSLCSSSPWLHLELRIAMRPSEGFAKHR